jgi:hypothetical protein
LQLENGLAWGRAEGRLERGEIDGARNLGVRLAGLSTGDPRVYDFLAAVESAAGNARTAGYSIAAHALRADLDPIESDGFPSC